MQRHAAVFLHLGIGLVSRICISKPGGCQGTSYLGKTHVFVDIL